jgi:hypothetical protein
MLDDSSLRKLLNNRLYTSQLCTHDLIADRHTLLLTTRHEASFRSANKPSFQLQSLLVMIFPLYGTKPHLVGQTTAGPHEVLQNMTRPGPSGDAVAMRLSCDRHCQASLTCVA